MLPHNKPERHKKPSSFNKVEMARIVTSMSDMTLASVSYGNTPLGSRMEWRMESTSGLVPSKTLSSI